VIHLSAAARLSGLLERPGRSGLLRRSLSEAWSRVANPVRDVALPAGARVVGVGGPILGGSFKTPFVLALARELANRGRAVAIASHGYRARVTAARRVLPSDDALEVGDDALFLARELDGLAVPVVVGKPWSVAIEHAASNGRTVLVDGLIQASPKRLDWSALVVDGESPWGSGRCPPAGDLRASEAALLAASDDVVEVVDRLATEGGSHRSNAAMLLGKGRSAYRVESDIVALGGFGAQRIPPGEVAHRRVGLLAAVARPERIVTALEARGIRPVEVRFFGDHRALPERRRHARREAPVDLWITTGKCATKLGTRYEGRPVWKLEHRLVLPSELVDRALGD
jgi:tetraacyldisaccharide 4'-kinase